MAFLRAGLMCLLVAGLAQPTFALDPLKWSKVNNESSKDYVMSITDFKLVVGNLYVKPASETGDGLKLSGAGASAVLKAKTKYLCFFEPNDKLPVPLAMTFAVTLGDEVTEINLKRNPLTGDRVLISPKKYMSASPVTIGLAGFRRTNGPAFLTIQDVEVEKKK